MTTSFVNGRTYPRYLPLSPPGTKQVPFISVNMAVDAKKGFTPVLGKVDTGADCTLLTLNTARTLGIADPTHGALSQKSITVANGQKLNCHTHIIWVDLSTSGLAVPQFWVYAGVSDGLVNNLFGIDWLHYLCMAFDRQKVHFLFD